MNRSRTWNATVLVGVGFVASCGARSPIRRDNDGPPLSADAAIDGCIGDLDCGPKDECAPVHCITGVCVAGPKVTCDDGDPCTTDSCLSDTGKCQFAALTHDEDGDGHRAPIPGFLPGAPGSCGDDCNDTSALAYPGAKEVCDGVDNDCNGVVDDGAIYVPSNAAPILLSTGASQAGLGGIAFGKAAFGVSFAAENTSWANTFTTFSSGAIVLPATAITHENTDAFSGPLVFTGHEFAMAWEDRRDKDFEIYFNRVDESGKKLSPDLRVTDAPKFSLRPDMEWDGAAYTVVWDDQREGTGVIFGQRIDGDGHLVGKNLPLTDPRVNADSPRIAKGETEVGLVFNEDGGNGRQLAFRTLSPDLSTLGTPVVLGTDDAASSAIAWSGDRYVVVWDTNGSAPGPTIRGAAISPSGSVVVAARDVTSVAAFARSEAILPLGNRLLLAWAEYQGGAYAIYTKMIDQTLNQLTSETRVTNGSSDALDPGIAFGPGGQASIAFEDRRTGSFQVYATSLRCVQ